MHAVRLTPLFGNADVPTAGLEALQAAVRPAMFCFRTLPARLLHSPYKLFTCGITTCTCWPKQLGTSWYRCAHAEGRHDAYSVSPRVEVTYMQAATPALIPRIGCYVVMRTEAFTLISK